MANGRPLAAPCPARANGFLMNWSAAIISVGGLFLTGLVLDEIGRRTRLPRVTLLILFGVLIGPAGLDLLPHELRIIYEPLTSIALTMVAFLLGGNLSRRALQQHGKHIITISATVVVTAIVLVGGGLLLIGAGAPLALLLAGIATATAPAATLDVIRQTGSTGPFAATLSGIVAIDDAWGLIAFSALLIAAKAVAGDGGMHILAAGGREFGISIALGLALGFPAAYLTGRLRKGEPIQSEALGIVFLCAGLAAWLHVSFLLAGMVAGIVVVNFASHHRRAFHEIEHIEWPFMLLFFVLAGASLEAHLLKEIGVIGAAYVVLRILSRIAGGYLGARLCGFPQHQQKWIGPALMPQAGVAVGMALVAGDHFPQLRETILTITIATTIVFELFGPLFTQIALERAARDGQ